MIPQFHGRKKPYTEIGISRVPCVRCGAPSHHQWQLCANDNRWMGLCLAHDLELNRMVLEWCGIPNPFELMERYQAKEAS